MTRLPALQIPNQWTPARIGTTGNELADEAAQAVTLLPAPPAAPVSLTTCKRRINVDVLDRWKALWAVAKTGRGLREIDDTQPSLILRSPYISSAFRPAISILAQLRTDFSSLNDPFPPALPRMGASTSAPPARFIQGRSSWGCRCPFPPD
ncbi:hypothetical protein DFH09DRAFT_1319126 [Mycena vulgaris]|nr:hypothetical protein DFH09DRAFT_1319126 [Mycena vulgaris]